MANERAHDRTDVLETGLVIGDRVIQESRGGVMEHINPTTGKPNKSFAIASVDDVDEAVIAAKDALVEWARWSPDRRRDALLRLADILAANNLEIATTSALEVGTVFSEFAAAYSAEWIRYYAGWADKITGDSINPYPYTGLDFTMAEPVGVVGLFVASNGPIGFCAMAGAPALAAGCTLVIKTPEPAPFGSVSFARYCREAGIPPGVVNVVHGGADVATALVTHPGVDKISFTGGTATGRKLQELCAATLKPLVLELGGKSANIVFADADVDAVIPMSSRWTMNSGQGCSMPTRLLVQRPVYDRVVDGVAEIIKQVVVGDPLKPGVGMGPVMTEAAMNRILRIIDDTVGAHQATVLLGGERMGGELADGFFVAPTILVDADNSSVAAQTEIFGPVLCITPFDDEDEAIALANGTDYGLAAYAHTNDMRRARRLVRELQAGVVHINGTGPGPISPAAPFGGVKQSGYGREGGRAGIDEFLNYKNVYLNI